MTQPDYCSDPAIDVLAAAVTIMRKLFDPAGHRGCAPLGGGTSIVRLFSCEGSPLPYFEPHSEDPSTSCKEPFVWVRLAQRFRTTKFPNQELVTACSGQEVLELELGAARCSHTDQAIDFAEVATETTAGINDSWLIGRAMCALTGELVGHNVAIDTIIPYGPEGGVSAWTGALYVGI